MFYLPQNAKYLFVLLALFCSRETLAQEPPMSEEEAQQLVSVVSSQYTRLRHPVFVHYANIIYTKVKNSWGDEEDAPVLSGYPTATAKTGLTRLELFMEADGLDEPCRIILVAPNYEQLRQKMIMPYISAELTEKAIFKMHLVHELGHCVEYQNMQQTGNTGWWKYSSTALFLLNRQEEDAKIWSESFADSFSALWMTKQGYTEAPLKLIALRESRKRKDVNHNTAEALKKLNALEVSNLCEAAQEARGGEKIVWSACK